MASTSVIQPARPRPAPKRPQVSRRSFLRRAWLTGLFASLAGFGAGSVYFLWPNLSGGFGTRIKAGTKTSIDADIKANDGYSYVPEGRFYLVPYSGNGADTVYKGVSEGGYMALCQRCVH